MQRLRRYFLTGFIIILPIVLTVQLISLFINYFNRFLIGPIAKYVGRYIPIGEEVVCFVILLLFILLVGLFASRFIGRKMILAVERLFERFPIVKNIYPAIKQLVNAVLSPEKLAFKKVVLVEYPRLGIYSLGFVTNEGMQQAKEFIKEDLINVLIPTTPSPFTGPFVLVPKSQVIFLDISIEEGLRMIVSGGVLNPEDIKKTTTNAR